MSKKSLRNQLKLQSEFSEKSDYDYFEAAGGYQASSGYGHGHGGHKNIECCPQVVDPLTVAAFLGLIGAITAFLSNFIATALVPMKIVGRKKRAANLWEKVKDGFQEGKQSKNTIIIACFCWITP